MVVLQIDQKRRRALGKQSVEKFDGRGDRISDLSGPNGELGEEGGEHDKYEFY